MVGDIFYVLFPLSERTFEKLLSKRSSRCDKAILLAAVDMLLPQIFVLRAL
jgi:hypothetical protein